MAQQHQHQLLEGISFQIDNMTFSLHLASFNGIQMQNADSLPHLKMMQAIELLGTRVAPALRKELGGGQVIEKEFNKISKLGYIEHILEFVYTEDGIV
jgi:hypothetical protein